MGSDPETCRESSGSNGVTHRKAMLRWAGVSQRIRPGSAGLVGHAIWRRRALAVMVGEKASAEVIELKPRSAHRSC